MANITFPDASSIFFFTAPKLKNRRIAEPKESQAFEAGVGAFLEVVRGADGGVAAEEALGPDVEAGAGTVADISPQAMSSTKRAR
ncbi:hypothetical protein PG984_005226 [Apiospora sp. TS-2023a]